MGEDARLRLFVAVTLADGVTAALGQAIEELRGELEGPFRWVAPAGIHLTLKFLGDVDRERVDDLAVRIAGAVEEIEPFQLRLLGAGTFPPGPRPSVVWAGLGGDTATLEMLRDAVESALVALGFPAEERPFRPHLTLARVRERLSEGDANALSACLASLRYADDAVFEVRGVELIRSELGQGGARYSTLSEARLRGASG